MKNSTTLTAAAKHAVDNTDWLKAAAILFVAIDHFGIYFIDQDSEWRLIGRLGAPLFFFLIGFAHTTRVPFYWIGIGVLLTVLDSWESNWQNIELNILLNFALIRLARPWMREVAMRDGYAAPLAMISVLLALAPWTDNLIEYGTLGWLLALCGLYQREHLDQLKVGIESPAGLTALRLACVVIAGTAYTYRQQAEFGFPPVQFAVLAVGMAMICVSMYVFRRGASTLQPPEAMASVLRFVGRHTLELYAGQLIVSIVIAKLMMP